MSGVVDGVVGGSFNNVETQVVGQNWKYDFIDHYRLYNDAQITLAALKSDQPSKFFSQGELNEQIASAQSEVDRERHFVEYGDKYHVPFYTAVVQTQAMVMSLATPMGEVGMASGAARGVMTETELGISASRATGNPAAIARGLGSLNSRQSEVLGQLPGFGSRTITGKSFGQRDLAAVMAETGDEFAMITTGGRRMIIRGNANSVPVSVDLAQQFSAQGWRWSSHGHPGVGYGVLRSSPGDRAVLDAMGGARSTITNSVGQRRMFSPGGDSLEGYLPF